MSTEPAFEALLASNAPFHEYARYWVCNFGQANGLANIGTPSRGHHPPLTALGFRPARPDERAYARSLVDALAQRAANGGDLAASVREVSDPSASAAEIAACIGWLIWLADTQRTDRPIGVDLGIPPGRYRVTCTSYAVAETTVAGRKGLSLREVADNGDLLRAVKYRRLRQEILYAISAALIPAACAYGWHTGGVPPVPATAG